ncbi:MAG: dTDP-4-dehydrorhamnose reductase [Dehalococcoidia bacterium]|nr:dTDP-4-dehydrorhamnose reductase [Dehalococcoidia bacterium]
MRVLITGSDGQLGRALVRACAPADAVLACGRAQLDVTDADAARRLFDRQRPDAVVHCAALTDTQACERDPRLAFAVNAGGAERVAVACAAVRARLVAISTNEVFDGAATEAYAEDAPAGALNAYGRSKLEGERRIAALGGDALTVRTSWLYGAGGSNFVTKVLGAAGAGRPLRFVTDEVASPTSAEDLAAALVDLLRREAPAGVYHLVNEGTASRYDWARETLRLAGIGGASVEPATTAALRAGGYDGSVKPPYSVLANTRARALGIRLPPWRASLAAHFARHPELRAAATASPPCHD